MFFFETIEGKNNHEIEFMAQSYDIFFLEKKLKSKNPEDRAKAVFLLGSLKNISSIPKIADLLYDDEEFVVYAAIRVFMVIQSPKVTPYLSEVLLRSSEYKDQRFTCLLYTSPSPRDATLSRMPSSA